MFQRYGESGLPVTKSVEAYGKKVRKHIERPDRQHFRERHRRRYDLYHGEYRQHILAILQEVCPKTWRDFKPVWLPYFRKVVDRRAGMFYAEPPERTYYRNGSPVPEAMADRIDATFGAVANDALDKVSRYIETHRTIAVAAVWRHNRVEFDVLTPQAFDVIPGLPDKSNIDDSDAFIQVGLGDEPSIVWVKQPDVIPSQGPCYFTVDGKGNALTVEENPYVTPNGAAYPFALLQYESPDGSIWIPGGEDLVEAVMSVVFRMTDNEFIDRYQAFGQPWFSGLSDELARSMILSPNEGFGLPQGATFQFATPGGSTTSRVEGLRSMLQLLANAYDLPADVLLSGNGTSSPESGIAKRIASVPLIEYRKSRIERERMYEQQVFDTWRTVHNTHAAPAFRIPWDVTLETTFAEMSLFFDPVEEDQLLSGRLAVGLESVVDVIAKRRKVSLDDARAILAQNRLDNAGSMFGVSRLGSGVPGSAPASASVAYEEDITSSAAPGPEKQDKGFRTRIAARLAERRAQEKGNGSGS